MIRLFVTGDVHIGLKYDRYPQIKARLIESRFECLKRCVEEAERQKCDFFVVAGDLFERTHGIGKGDIKKTVDILSEFNGHVLVLPGNHDYYTGEEDVWKSFEKELGGTGNNVTLIKEFKAIPFEEENVTFYPAFCQAKHSRENNLAWIKDARMDGADYHVGLAHGAIKGLSADLKYEYFLMTEPELKSIPVDVWLIGHTHVPYPADLKEDEDAKGYRIFNPGTPEQTDLANNSPGLCFVITLDKSDGKTVAAAHRFTSGAIRFYDIAIDVHDTGLRQAIEDKVDRCVDTTPENAVIRITVSGVVSSEDYENKEQIYQDVLKKFMTYERNDEELSERITKERIRDEFPEFGFAAKFLESLDDSKELQMAYDLIRKNRE